MEGANTMIDAMTAAIADAEGGFCMIFSAQPFPGAQWTLDWVRPELSGNVYHCDAFGQECWLCPALFHYFTQAPPHIYVKVEARP